MGRGSEWEAKASPIQLGYFPAMQLSQAEECPLPASVAAGSLHWTAGGFKVEKGTKKMEPGSLEHRDVTFLAEGCTASLKVRQAGAAAPVVKNNEG